MDLRATWPGKALFTAAYLRILPQTAPAASLTPPRRAVTPRVRRGATVHYERGPAFHRRGKRGPNWTNYMVSTILSYTDTVSAEQAHRASGQYQDKKLDFAWMFKNFYITKVQP